MPTLLPRSLCLALAAAAVLAACRFPPAPPPPRREAPPPLTAPLEPRRERDLLASAMLEAHNRVRRAEDAGLADLTWEPALAALAHAWAIHLRDTKRCQIEHRDEPQLHGAPVGENLFAIFRTSTMRETGPLTSPDDVVAAWANEREHFDLRRNRCATGEICGHYTQLVWRGTKHVGCAFSSCDDGAGRRAEVWVCNYSPAGNWVGERPY